MQGLKKNELEKTYRENGAVKTAQIFGICIPELYKRL